MSQKIAIIGGGASGIFCAIQLLERIDAEIHIFEKSNELLKKVKISGGGRCNVTHDYKSPSQFVKSYPRGHDIMKRNLSQFSPLDMQNWLYSKGIELNTEDDGRVFPKSNSSQTIIDCFLQILKSKKVFIHFNTSIDQIILDSNSLIVNINNRFQNFDKIIVATGGASNKNYLEPYQSLSIKTIDPVPSLFTFKTSEKKITELMGIALPNSQVKIVGTKLVERGALLITHWGFSGPAILKLSAWGAFELAQSNYKFKININWDAQYNEETLRTKIEELKNTHPKALIINKKIASIPQRLWNYLVESNGISMDQKWGETNKKELNKLIHSLIQSEYEIHGKTTFKEEFVTAGGIDLDSIDIDTMQSKTIPNLYFIGELLNVDGITGGYNFQNAWTSAFVAAQNIAKS